MGVPPLELDWDVDAGPWFDNSLATLSLHGGQARLVVETAWTPDGESELLRPVLDRALAGADGPVDAARA